MDDGGLSSLMTMLAGVHPPAIPHPAAVPAPVVAPTPSGGQGIDWRALLQLTAPLIATIGSHDPSRLHFANGWLQGQQAAQQARQQVQDRTDKKNQQGADYLMRVGEHAQTFDDPVALDNFLKLADDAGVQAGYTQKGALRNRFTVPQSVLADKRLKEVNDQLAELGKSYDLDELAQSGAVLTLKNGTHVPVETAIGLTRARPLDASGQPIARPKKPTGKTEEERFIEMWAKENDTDVDHLTTDEYLAARNQFRDQTKTDKTATIGTFSDYLGRLAKSRGVDPDTLNPKDIEDARKAYEASGRNTQFDEINRNLKELQLQAAQNKAREGQAQQDIKPGTKEYRLAADLASGDLTMQDFSKFVTARGAGGQNANALRMSLYDKAREINPNFSPAAFEMGYKFAANPKIKQQMASIKNVESGVDDLLKASDQASRTGVPMLNRFIVPGGVALGGKRYSDFKTAQTAFADELSGALGYGSATDMSREMGFSMTDPNLSPAQFRSAVENVIVPFLNRKKSTLLGEMGPYSTTGQPTGQPPPGAPPPVGNVGPSYQDYLRLRGGQK